MNLNTTNTVCCKWHMKTSSQFFVTFLWYFNFNTTWNISVEHELTKDCGVHQSFAFWWNLPNSNWQKKPLENKECIRCWIELNTFYCNLRNILPEIHLILNTPLASTDQDMNYASFQLVFLLLVYCRLSKSFCLELCKHCYTVYHWAARSWFRSETTLNYLQLLSGNVKDHFIESSCFLFVFF